MNDISRFDENYQKQLAFNFSATRATRKKPVAMIDAQAWASRLWDVDLDVAPTSFSCDTTDHHDLSRYIWRTYYLVRLVLGSLCEFGRVLKVIIVSMDM